MITNIEIVGFKRFYRESLAIAPLTVLAGLNGSGKTSVIHALLLACEASASNNNSVRLNGPFGMELGTAEDVRNWESGESIEIHLKSQTVGDVRYQFGVPSDDALYLHVNDKPSNPPLAFSLQPRAFSYLCAERFGPRNVLGASPLPTDDLEVGYRGEHCAQILSILGDKPIQDKGRLHPHRIEGSPELLKYEVERWLGEIARPVEINAEAYFGATVTSLRFRSPGGEWVRAPNMGFGVSYALPIILVGLTALSGGLVVVESPEAHLHPAGQSRMGVFLAWLAGRGVQVILETHSDHVLNGIRRAIAEHKYLAHTDATVHYFESQEDDSLRIHPLKFTSMGAVSHWPPGFFDQYQIDVSSLGRIRRQN
jgi:predicted ATPase